MMMPMMYNVHGQLARQAVLIEAALLDGDAGVHL
jgi:hypothetical protein